jgi:ribosomal protein S18 acetylase RimI-like enzyme
MGDIDYMKNKQISILVAKTAEEFADGRMLFEAYAASLNFNLCFQGFTEELQTLDQQYNSPTGALIIAYHGDNAIAVVGVRKFDSDKAELKRMYTLTEFRGQKIGYQLLNKAINIAKELGYTQLLLDTLPEMQAAIKLYRYFGFIESSAYRFNPFDEAIYMKLDLTTS